MALYLFFELLLARRIRVLTIVIDNTSVRDTMVRGSSRSEIMNQFIVASIEILKSLGCRVIIRYIPTDLNPSDAVSRGAIPEWTAWTQELATWLDERHGVAETGFRTLTLY